MIGCIAEILRQPKPIARYRLGVGSRALAGIGGGYALTSAITALLSVCLPMQRADAVIVGTLISFAVFACAVFWAFAVRSALRAWVGIILPALLAGGILLARHYLLGAT